MQLHRCLRARAVPCSIAVAFGPGTDGPVTTPSDVARLDHLERGSMATKAELIDAVATSAGVSKADAERTIGAFFDHVTKATKKRREGRLARLRLVQHDQAGGPHRPQPADRCAGEDRRVEGDEVHPERHPQGRAQPEEEGKVTMAVAKKAPAKKAAGEEGSGQEGRRQEGAGQEGAAKKAPAKKAPAKKAPAKKAPAKKAPAKKAAGQEGAGEEGRRQEGAGQEGRRPRRRRQEGAGEEGARPRRRRPRRRRRQAGRRQEGARPSASPRA